MQLLERGTYTWIAGSENPPVLFSHLPRFDERACPHCSEFRLSAPLQGTLIVEQRCRQSPLFNWLLIDTFRGYSVYPDPFGTTGRHLGTAWIE